MRNFDTFLASGKVALATIVGGTTSATARWLELVPDVITGIGGLVSACLGIVLIRYNWRKMRREDEKHKLEMEKLKGDK